MPPSPPPPPRPPVPPSAIPPLGAGNAAAALGGLVTAAGAVTVGLGVLVTASTLVSAAFNGLAERLSDFDASIAEAAGLAEARRIQGNLQQARELSGPMSAQINRQTNLELTLQRIETSLIKWLEPIAKKLGDLAQTVASAVEFILNPNLSSLKVIASEIAIFIINETVPFGLAKRLTDKLEAYIDKELNDFKGDAKDFQKEILDSLDPNRGDLLSEIENFEGNKDFRNKPRPAQFH